MSSRPLGSGLYSGVVRGALALALCSQVLAGCGGGGDPATELRVELEANAIVVYVDDPDVNVPATAGGAREVSLECVDSAGEVRFQRTIPWPLTETDGGTSSPHAHVPLAGLALGGISHCRLRGTEGPLNGRPSFPR
ncbi:MAG TPA: hypothetical protein VHF90_10740 [Thermoleophilaceae bacterium]|nr:hypothetical protein [Thermoleophilaceae bacterium]